MWIRSQDRKKLIKCDNLNIRNCVGLLVGKFTIENNGITLGVYSTEEKALNVLNKIEEHIKNMYVGTGTYMGKPFQMPQDSEV